ncbi:alpha/beta-hydrolase [Marasmius fiardii PR-910]|nr:alpha/beta-hydrolase [Marasmius fiardii PR-910]
MFAFTVLGLLALSGFQPLVTAQPIQDSTAPVVDLGYAKYQGTFNGTTNVTSFLGMRFAAAPVGELRWKAPTLPVNESSKGIQKADTQPSQCAQAFQGAADRNPLLVKNTGQHQGLEKRQSGGVAPSDTPVDEDCLFLNVQYPGNTVPDKSLPVLVYIHGGGYIEGGANLYDGSYLVEQSDQGVVTVVFQYRLGLFGFLAGEKVKSGGDLNVGLLDQNFALRWVREHISKFGGDPERVTLWGKSAGGGSVLQQVIAEDGKTSPQLFRAALASSPYLPAQYKYNDRIPEALYKQVVDQVNCTSAEDSLACLRQVDTKALQDVNAKINLAGFYGTFTFVPVVDGKFITQRPTKAMQQKKVNGNILYAVHNSNEGTIYVNSEGAPMSPGDFATQLFPTLGPKEVAAINGLYKDLGTPFEQGSLILGEATFICSAYYLLDAFNNRAFMGNFAVPPANHLNDIAYTFPSASSAVGPVNSNNTDFIEAFARSFTSFAVSLNPGDKLNSPTSNQWGMYGSGKTEMIFNTTSGDLPDIHIAKSNDALLRRCRFWQSLGPITGQ